MMACKRWTSFMVFWGVFFLLVGQVYAQSETGDQWSFSITPYSWLSKLEGRMATLPLVGDISLIN